MKVNKNVLLLTDKEDCTAKGNHTIPKELINEDNVFLDFYCGSHELYVRFSVNIDKEFSSWPKEKVKDIIDDMHNELNEFFMYQPWKSATKEMGYQVAFRNLKQVY